MSIKIIRSVYFHKVNRIHSLRYVCALYEFYKINNNQYVQWSRDEERIIKIIKIINIFIDGIHHNWLEVIKFGESNWLIDN